MGPGSYLLDQLVHCKSFVPLSCSTACAKILWNGSKFLIIEFEVTLPYFETKMAGCHLHSLSVKLLLLRMRWVIMSIV